MRYQVFNCKTGGEPVLSAPWAWLAQALTLRAANSWDWFRLVDSRSGKTLLEWARAQHVGAGQPVGEHQAGYQGERAFWGQVIEAQNPGWTIVPEMNPDTGTPLGLHSQVHIYVVDTGQGWTTAGGTTLERAEDSSTHWLERAREYLSGLPDEAALTPAQWGSTLLLAAADLVRRAAALGSRSGDRAAVNAVNLAWVAMTRSGSFQAVRKTRSSLAGHWLLMVFRLANGSTYCTPVFAAKADAGDRSLTPAELEDLVVGALRANLMEARSELSSRSSAAGGMALHPKYADALRAIGFKV